MSRVVTGCPVIPTEIVLLSVVGFVVLIFVVGVFLVYGWERLQARVRGEAE